MPKTHAFVAGQDNVADYNKLIDITIPRTGDDVKCCSINQLEAQKAEHEAQAAKHTQYAADIQVLIDDAKTDLGI